MVAKVVEKVVSGFGEGLIMVVVVELLFWWLLLWCDKFCSSRIFLGFWEFCGLVAFDGGCEVGYIGD